MKTTAKHRNLILLHEEDNAQVVVTPKNSDRFVVTVEEAVRACRAYEKEAQFKVQFECLVELLNSWIHNHFGALREATLTVRETDVLFLVVQKEKIFDDRLADDLTKLDMTIATDERFSLIDLEVMAIPSVSNESAKAFLSSE